MLCVLRVSSLLVQSVIIVSLRLSPLWPFYFDQNRALPFENYFNYLLVCVCVHQPFLFPSTSFVSHEGRIVIKQAPLFLRESRINKRSWEEYLTSRVKFFFANHTKRNRLSRSLTSTSTWMSLNYECSSPSHIIKYYFRTKTNNNF